MLKKKSVLKNVKRLQHKIFSRKAQVYMLGIILMALFLLSTALFLYVNTLSQRESYYVYSENFASLTQSVKEAIEKVVAGALATYTTILDVSGNSSFARIKAEEVLNAGIRVLTSSFSNYGLELKYEPVNCSLADEEHPYRKITSEEVFKAYWFYPDSVSGVGIRFSFNLTEVGLYNYKVSGHGSAYFSLKVKVLESKRNIVKISVTGEGNVPVLNLDETMIKLFIYNGSVREWVEETPEIVTIFQNGTYILNHTIPPNFHLPTISGGVVPIALKVRDHRGVIVNAFAVPSYTYSLSINQPYNGRDPSKAVYEVEVQNDGVWRFLGQELESSNCDYGPVPPLPVRLLRVNASNEVIPFQVEDWNSNLTIPLGLSNPHTHFQKSNKLVFLLNSTFNTVKIWWSDDMDAEQIINKTDLQYDPATRWHSNTYYKGRMEKLTVLGFDFPIPQLALQHAGHEDEYIFGTINSLPPFGWASYSDPVTNCQARNMLSVEMEYQWQTLFSSTPDTYVLLIVTFPAHAKYATFTLHLITDRVTAKSISNFEVLRSYRTFAHFAVQAHDGNRFQGCGCLLCPPPYKFCNDTSCNIHCCCLWGFIWCLKWCNYNQDNGEHHWLARWNDDFGTGLMLTTKNLEQLYNFSSRGGIIIGLLNALYLKPVDNTLLSSCTTGNWVLSANGKYEVYTWQGLIWIYGGGSYQEIEDYSVMVREPPEILSISST